MFIKVSKENKDVQKCSIQDLIFHSDFPLLKIHKQGGGEVTLVESPAGTYSKSISIGHKVRARNGGDVRPMFIAYTEWYNDSGLKETSMRQFSISTHVGTLQDNMHYAYTDFEKINFFWYIPTGVGGSTIKMKYYYFIFEDPIENV